MFYVYALVDPRDGKPFYVGKGKGKRVEQHEQEARCGRVSRKCERIRAIWSVGLRVIRDIRAEFADEKLAYCEECRLIEEIGLESLTNVYIGGGGGFSKRRGWSETAVRKLAPKLLWFLSEYKRCGNFCVYGLREFDVSADLNQVVANIRKDIGAVSLFLLLKEARDGFAQKSPA
jgi:hypothetical protein